MSYNRLFILVEGDDDERFFNRVLKPFFVEKYDSVTLWKYARKRSEKIKNFIKSINAMGADYVYLRDINDAPCITAKKKRICDKFKEICEDKIIIVVKEIESWYLAGLSDGDAKKFKINPSKIKTTDNIAKEQFNKLILKNSGDSRINFMIELLENFSIETGKIRNKSFKYFSNAHIRSETKPCPKCLK
ncbi:MAG: hypothetical protein CVT90_00850 [Candidatus Altiarchaeales archaeon HGW-Altiarchaeales-3]|nr:MAG: hypothetical protein CVT90_00850 [Candidatus Altiarchaeales archaeon HGW-Altiarchaeales-3]